jgi:hypothetical protein
VQIKKLRRLEHLRLSDPSMQFPDTASEDRQQPERYAVELFRTLKHLDKIDIQEEECWAYYRYHRDGRWELVE